MEREFPKNVKQIGNVCDEPKIYVEDYVDTYLNQLRERAQSEPVGAVLTGEILKMDGVDVVYVAGALKLHDIGVEGTEITISDEAWRQMKEEKKRFFSGQDLVGWCLIGEGQPGVLIKGIQKVHCRFFKKNNTVFMWRDAALEEEELYANKFKELMQIGGHYIFYEKNPSMQNYMINMRKKIGVTPSEVVEDRAAKDFRSAVKEKREYKEHRQNARFAYAVSVALVLVVLVIGVSTINNYDKMESVQDSLETLSQSVTRPQAKETRVEEVKQETSSERPEKNDVEIKEEAVEAKEEAGEEKEETQADEGEKKEQDADTPDLQSRSEAGYYIVQKGDTLDKISIKVYGSRGRVDDICRMNGLSDGNLIIIGQKLLLP